MLGPSLRMLGPNHVLNIQSLPLFRTNVKAFFITSTCHVSPWVSWENRFFRKKRVEHDRPY